VTCFRPSPLRSALTVPAAGTNCQPFPLGFFLDSFCPLVPPPRKWGAGPSGRTPLSVFLMCFPLVRRASFFLAPQLFVCWSLLFRIPPCGSPYRGLPPPFLLLPEWRIRAVARHFLPASLQQTNFLTNSLLFFLRRNTGGHLLLPNLHLKEIRLPPSPSPFFRFRNCFRMFPPLVSPPKARSAITLPCVSRLPHCSFSITQPAPLFNRVFLPVSPFFRMEPRLYKMRRTISA